MQASRKILKQAEAHYLVVVEMARRSAWGVYCVSMFAFLSKLGLIHDHLNDVANAANVKFSCATVMLSCPSNGVLSFSIRRVGV